MLELLEKNNSGFGTKKSKCVSSFLDKIILFMGNITNK